MKGTFANFESGNHPSGFDFIHSHPVNLAYVMSCYVLVNIYVCPLPRHMQASCIGIRAAGGKTAKGQNNYPQYKAAVQGIFWCEDVPLGTE